VLVGKSTFLEAERVEISATLRDQAAALQVEGKTVLFAAIDGRAAGLLAVADPIKSSTPEAVAALHELGIKIVVATGDNRRTAAAVAKQLGLERVEAEVEPADKIKIVNSLKTQGGRAGTDVAMESAGITLVKGDLRGLAKAVHLSRATMRNIRQNLFFAFVYNALGVPIAAGILYPFFGLLLSPIIAGAAMSFSSVSVISNALRLRRTRL
jgi:Cu+-exporting ATPase